MNVRAIGLLAVAGAALGVGLWLSPGARADGWQDFAGTYGYAGNAVEKRAIDAEVDRVTATFSPELRAAARAKMKTGAWMPRRVRIVIKGKEVGIQKDDQPLRMTRMDGKPAVFAESGRDTTLTHSLEGDALTEVTRTDDAVRTLVMRLSGGNQILSVTGTVDTQPFKSPFRYRATFRRIP